MIPPSSKSRAVSRLYQFGSARWYNAFRTIWTRATSRQAESELDRMVRVEAEDARNVLDIGCGTGHNLGRLLRLGGPFESYRGVDLTQAMLEIARADYHAEARATFDQTDLHDLEGSTERYDLILCTWVASHLERPRDVFEVAYRLLAPGGSAFLLTLTRPRWYVRAWFTPFVLLFQAAYVDPEDLRDLPGLCTRTTWTARLATLVHLKRPPREAPEGSQ